MFTNIKDKEKYFIQPFIDGKECHIKIYSNKRGIQIKAFNNLNEKIKISSGMKKQLRYSYKTSKYFNFAIILKGFLVNDVKNRTSLYLYDLLLESEYNGLKHSMKYGIRYENMILRFLSGNQKDVKLIFSYPYSDFNIDLVINQFVKMNILDKIVFRKNISYDNDSDDSVIIQNISQYHIGKLISYTEGTINKKETDEKTNEVISETEIPCVNSLIIFDEELNQTITAELTTMSDSERVDLLYKLNDYDDKKCSYKSYDFLGRSGFIFNDFIN